MKLTIFLGVIVVVSAFQQEKFRIPADSLSRIQKISDSCAAEFNVDPGLFPKLADGTLPRNEMTNNYMHCFARKTDIVDEIGHINIDKLTALLANHPRVNEFKDVVSKCNDVTKENPVATVVQMNDCYASTAPVLLVFE